MRASATKGYEKDYVARYADASKAGKNCINVLRCRRVAADWKKMMFNKYFTRPIKRCCCRLLCNEWVLYFYANAREWVFTDKKDENLHRYASSCSLLSPPGIIVGRPFMKKWLNQGVNIMYCVFASHQV